MVNWLWIDAFIVGMLQNVIVTGVEAIKSLMLKLWMWHVQCLLFCDAVTLDQLLKQENIVLEFWTTRKRRIDQCQQYVVLETSAKQVIFHYS